MGDWRVRDLGAQSALAGGGRYDGLAEVLGHAQPVPAVGFAAGLERLFLALDAAGYAPSRGARARTPSSPLQGGAASGRSRSPRRSARRACASAEPSAGLVQEAQ